MKTIAVIMGSDSDLAVAQKAMDTLREFGAPYTVRVLSAHRTADVARTFALSARKNGFGALIAVAGMAAHLAGALAANTTLPVGGVPVASEGFGGLDALLSTVQMPSGVPVATVAVNGGRNAALLCLQMLAIEDETLTKELDDARTRMAREALEKDALISARYSSHLEE